MSWTLTTPLSSGDLDTGSYAEVKIIHQSHDSVNCRILLTLEYGNTVEDVWIPGIQPQTKQTSVLISGTDYDTLIANSEPEVEETTYDAVKRGLYAYLSGNAIIDAGSLT